MDNQATKKQVLDVIRLYGGRVTPGDIVVHTGLTESESINQLNQLALNMRSRLEVKATGDILYCFPDIAWYEINILGKTISKRLWLLSLVSYYIIVGTFRFLLLWSLILVIPAAISLPLLGMLALIERMSGFGWVPMTGIMTALVLGIYLMNKSGGIFLSQAVSFIKRFLNDCQSFVVGIPRSSVAFELDMWHKISEFIRQEGGVAIYEQLSQFTGTDIQDADKVFPILVRFDGRPQVTGSGNIIYTFPSLLVSADSKISPNVSNCPEEPLWHLTNINKKRVLLVLLYATTNFIAYMALLHILNPTPHFHWLTVVIYVSLIFSVFFFVYPLFRAFIIMLLNIPIVWRNSHRQHVMKLLASPSIQLKQKLQEAYEYQQKIVDISNEKTVYHTDKDTLEQQFENWNDH